MDDTDRQVFLEIFGNVVEKHNWLCHAFCLLDNHYHILAETQDPNLSLGMRHLNGVYTQRVNLRHHRVGHLLQEEPGVKPGVKSLLDSHCQGVEA